MQCGRKFKFGGASARSVGEIFDLVLCAREAWEKNDLAGRAAALNLFTTFGGLLFALGGWDGVGLGVKVEVCVVGIAGVLGQVVG